MVERLGVRGLAAPLAGAALLNACLGSLFAWSIFLDPLQAEFGWSRGNVSSVFALSLAVFAATVLLGGGLVDRHPPRTIALAAAACAGVGMVAGAATASLWWLALTYGGLFGVGNGLGYAAAVGVGGKWFRERRALALGLIVSAYAAGPLVAAPLGTRLNAVIGWRATFVAFGVGLAALMVVGAGLLGRGGPQPGPSSEPGPAAEDGSASLRRQPAAYLLWATFLLGSLPALMAFGHAAPIVLERGYSAAAAGAAVGALAVGNLAGRALAGWVGDRVGPLPALEGTLAVATVCLALLSGAVVALALFAALAGLGAAYGAQSSLTPAATAELFGRARFGTNYGRIFTGWGAAGLLGPLLGAWVYDLRGDYLLAFRIGLACVALALLLAYRLAHDASRADLDRPRPEP